MLRRVNTFCRICEPACGLIAEVENDRLVGIEADKEHPVSKGFACHKGTKFDEVHHDPDRLKYPMRRRNAKAEYPAQFERTGWDEVINDMGERLTNILDLYGVDAIASYTGNPMAFNAFGVQAVGSFLRKLGIRRNFDAASQDCSNKFAGSEAVFGTNSLHPVPDIDNTDYLLLLGENPQVSHMSFFSIPNPMKKIRDARARGAQIRYINPRLIESAGRNHDEVVQIKPDTDVYLLAAMLNEIDRLGRFDEHVINEHGKNIDQLREFIHRYPPERVATVTGIEAADICRLADEFSAAQSAAIHMSTGVNMGRQGTLAYWLVHMMSFVTGNLDRSGGNLYSLGYYPGARSGRNDLQNLFHESPFGDIRYVRGSLPGNLLADYIESEENPIRALIVTGGNPLLSIAGGDRLRKAMEKLELLIVIDLYQSATAELADYLLPAADMLERSDITIIGLGMQQQPYAQFTEAVIVPQYERKEEWWIFARMEQAMGYSSLLDSEGDTPLYNRLNNMLAHSDLSIARLKDEPSGTAILPSVTTDRFYTDHIQTQDKRVDCCPPIFDESISNMEQIFLELEQEPEDQLKLISLRTNFMHNGWQQNVKRLKQGHIRKIACI